MSEYMPTPKITHALSIREPFGYLITAGFKLAEIRSVPFPKKFVGPTWVAVHAAMSREELGDEDLSDYLVDLDEELGDIMMDERWGTDGRRLFGYSEIIGAMRVNHSFVADDATEEQWDRWADAMHARSERCATGIEPNEFLDEQHNWIIDDVYRFQSPIVCIGRLGVWPLDRILSKLVNAEMAKAIKTGGAKRSDPVGKPVIYQMPKGAKKWFGRMYPSLNAD